MEDGHHVGKVSVKRDNSRTVPWHAGDAVDINSYLHAVKVAP
jgi:hypothetical protein